MLKIKLFAVFAFLAFACCAFLFGNNETQAQSGKTDGKRAEVLEKIADYKVWKQVQKPENKPGNLKEKDVLEISNSSSGG